MGPRPSDQTPRKSQRWLANTAIVSAVLLMLTGCSQGQAPAGSTEAVSSHDKLPQSIQDAGKLRVATTFTTVPFSSKEAGEPVGVIPELAEAVAQRLDVNIEYLDMPLSGHVPALQAGRIDASWSINSDTKEREGVVDLIPYMQNRSTPIVAADNPHQVSDAEDLCGLRVGTVRGGESFLATQAFDTSTCVPKELPMELSQYEKSSDALLQIQSGNIDAFVGSGLQLENVAKTHNNGQTYKYIDSTLQGKNLVVATQKGNGEISSALQEALIEVVESGDYERILSAHGAASDGLAIEDIQVNPLTGR